MPRNQDLAKSIREYGILKSISVLPDGYPPKWEKLSRAQKANFYRVRKHHNDLNDDIAGALHNPAKYVVIRVSEKKAKLIAEQEFTVIRGRKLLYPREQVTNSVFVYKDGIGEFGPTGAMRRFIQLGHNVRKQAAMMKPIDPPKTLIGVPFQSVGFHTGKTNYFGQADTVDELVKRTHFGASAQIMVDTATNYGTSHYLRSYKHGDNRLEILSYVYSRPYTLHDQEINSESAARVVKHHRKTGTIGTNRIHNPLRHA